MNLDPVRLARQETAFNRWRAGKEVKGVVRAALGLITAVTGFGKTYILVLAIKYMNERYPDRTAIVVVPSTKLSQDWVGYWSVEKNKTTGKEEKIWIKGHLENFNLRNTQVFVVNTFVKYTKWECDLLGLDECHRYSNEDAQYFSTLLQITKFRFLLGMSATLSKRQEEFFLRYGIPIVDVIDEMEAQKYGYTAPSIIYNLGIALTEADKTYSAEIDAKFRSYFSKFSHEFDLVKACNGKKDKLVSVRLKDGTNLGKKTPREWIEAIGRTHGYDGTVGHPYSPQNVARNAAQCMFCIRERKNKWQNAPQKLDLAVKIIQKFPVQTIAFSETAEFADKLVEKLPEIAVAFHTKLKTIGVKGTEIVESENRMESADLKEQGYIVLGKTRRKALALKLFEDKTSPVRVMSTVRAMDEGVDIPSIEMVLMLAYSSVARQDTQRKGRGARIDYENLGKKTLVINLYMMGTQEEKWLKEKQKGGKAVIWVDSVEQISLNKTIQLGTRTDGNEEVTIKKSNIESGISRIDSQATTSGPVDGGQSLLPATT